MHVIADLQLHSRFSRAVSNQMTLPNIAAWAGRKGIGLVATGDWTHPMWFREIERDLVETGNGLLKLATGTQSQGSSIGKTLIPNPLSRTPAQPAGGLAPEPPLFLLATEVSCIYSQGGKVRRIHTLIWVPSVASARKISQEMTRRGCNLLSDGRPIIGLTSIQVAELVFTIEPKALIIPAHCLLPESMILGENFVPKRIDSITKKELVVTHTGEFHKVTEIKKRPYKGKVFHIQPWYFRPGLVTTPEHPYFAIKTIKKCPSTGDICRPSRSHLASCKRKACLQYKPAWIKAEDLSIGDVLIYPRSFPVTHVTNMYLDVKSKAGSTVRAGGSRGRVLKNTLPLTSDLGRLVGYFIAEGSTDGDNSFSFCFSEKEQEYIKDVVELVRNVFGIEYYKEYSRKESKGIEITFYSKIHAQWFARECYVLGKRHDAAHKMVPGALLNSAEIVQAECLRGWYRGDHGYTTSRVLVHQMKAICLRLGIIPSILIDSAVAHKKRGNHRIGNRIVKARYDLYSFSNLSFFDDAFHLKKEIPRSQTKLDRRHGWIDRNNAYLPIKDITKSMYEGDVYNLEVEKDHSYLAEYAAVHNCWTPWFSVFGGMSGFESLAEAFGPYEKQIYAIETGLSSNPAMNWQIAELDSRTIVSFSDAHSGPKLGREATVLEVSGQSSMLSYQHVYDAIVSSSLKADSRKLKASIAYTIEFYPEEGKYHYSGHRNCNIRLGPAETSTQGTTCPVCGKPLTQGVMQRVGELAQRSEKELRLTSSQLRLSGGTSIRATKSETFPQRPPFISLVPLAEIIAESIGSPVTSPKVLGPYLRLTDNLGSEFNVLLAAQPEDIARLAGERVAQGVQKVRAGDLVIDPGYDGVFGKVKLWHKGEDAGLVDETKKQLSIF